MLEEGCDVGWPPTVHRGADRCTQKVSQIRVVPAPSGAAVLWTTCVLNHRGGKCWGRRRMCGNSTCNWGSAAQASRMLQHQHLASSASSGRACSRDAVAVSTRYLPPAYCWHSNFSLCLFLGTNGMICHRSELQMLERGFTSPGHWQT